MTVRVGHRLPEEEARIVRLMCENGYMQVFRAVSSFDGWYVKTSIDNKN